jgi:hypothetical protein
MRPKPSARAAWAVAALCVVATAARPPAAIGLEAGSVLIAAQAATSDGDYLRVDGTALVPYAADELGALGEAWWFLADGVGLSLSGGLRAGRSLSQVDGLPDAYARVSAWTVRAGLDRFVQVADGVHLFMGPGAEVWRGRATFRSGAAPEQVTPRAWRYSGSGRLGGLIVLSDSFGLIGQVGCRIGWAKASDDRRSLQWYPGGLEGSAGLVWAF